PFIVPMSFS
ncbi:hypothetical protein PGANDO_0468, partial [Porphyromonas gingivalis]